MIPRTPDTEEAKARKPKNNRACGARFELELCKDARARGLEARKHAMSGSLEEKGDMTVTDQSGDKWVGEAKWRKELPKWFVDCLGDHDFAVFKEARGRPFVILHWGDFLTLLTARSPS